MNQYHPPLVTAALTLLGLATAFIVPCHAEEHMVSVANAANKTTSPVLIMSGSAPPPQHKLALWYRAPATDWASQALPIGNGYMGGMVYGGITEEQIQYNEKTLWAGGPSKSRPNYQGGNRDDAHTFIEQARAMIRAGDEAGAMKFMNQHCAGDANGFGSSQSFGDVRLKFNYKPGEIVITNYRREVDLEDGVARVSYTVDGADYLREYFCSYPDRVMVMRLTCSHPGKLGVDVYETCGHGEGRISVSGDQISMRGALSDNQMLFESQLKVINEGGTLTSGTDKLTVSGANAVTILLTAGTDYANVYPAYRGEDPHDAITKRLAAASAKKYSRLLSGHQADYKRLFDRVRVNVNNDDFSAEPTNVLRSKYRQSQTSRFYEMLAFQYGRYLLIQSSREGTLPAHLQGVWNNSNTPAWCGDYHFDYNVQMNYCGAEVANLHECSLPYVDFLYSLIKPGQVTAAKSFGVTNGGWVLNSMVNAFGFTAPGWSIEWGWQPEGAPWGAQYAWDAYKFTGDQKLLREKIYPVIKGNSDFWKGWLIKDADNTLISFPSISLEEGPLGVPMIDQMLAWEVVNNTIEAANALGIDRDYASQMREYRDRICPPLVGKWGQLQEWKKEIDKPTGAYGVGQMPQCIAIYAGRRISMETTPDWAKAAMVSLSLADRNFRNNGCAWGNYNRGTAWSRFYNGESAHMHYRNMIGDLTLDNLFSTTGGSMQLDGTFAATGMLSEMLIQSHLDNVRVLPALPKVWSSGSFKGLCARGGFVVDATWESGELTCAKVSSKLGGMLTFAYKDKCLNVPTKVGGNYLIIFKGGELTLK